MRNGVKGVDGYQNDDFEYAVTQYQGKPLVFRHHASDATCDSLFKELGAVQDAKAFVKAEDGKTIYEMAFSQFSISPFT